METPYNKIVSTTFKKVLCQLVAFILSLYMLYPDLALALDMDNILLPNGKVPAPRLLSTNSGDYISLSELRRVFLSDFERSNSYELIDKANRRIVFLPGSIFVTSKIASEQYVAQLSKPIFRTTTASGYDELFVPYSDLPQFLSTINIYEIIELGDKIALQNKVIVRSPNIPEFSISEQNDENNIEEPESNIIVNFISSNPESTEDVTEQEVYNPGKIVTNAVLNNSKSAIPKANYENIDINYSILPTAIAVINNTRDAFNALKPKNEKILYLEPNIIQPATKTKEFENKLNETTPPNVFVVPKGLFRRGIDNND